MRVCRPVRARARVAFAVVGSAQFPLEMLRYDDCRPSSRRDAELIISKTPCKDGSQVRIELIHVGDECCWEPTLGRWTSFGWAVVRDSVRVERA